MQMQGIICNKGKNNHQETDLILKSISTFYSLYLILGCLSRYDQLCLLGKLNKCSQTS